MNKFHFLLSLLIIQIQANSLRQNHHSFNNPGLTLGKDDSVSKYNHEGYSPSSSSSATKKSTESMFGSFATGCILIVFSILLLWFNERRAVITRYRLLHAAEECMIVPSSEINPNCEGTLVHTNGKAVTNDLCVDEQFGVTESNCYKLVREVEILQWVERTESRSSGNDTYTDYFYDLSWCSSPVNSGSFRVQQGHMNDPSFMVTESKNFLNPLVYVGMFKLSDSLKKQTSNTEPVGITQTNVQLAQQTCGGRHQFISQSGQYIYFKLTQYDQISGDVRVSFKKVPCGDASINNNMITIQAIISQQCGQSFVPYVIHDKYDEQNNGQLEEQGCCSALCECFKQLEAPISEIDWISEAIYSREEIFSQKLKQNNVMTTIIRIVGWFLMGIGFDLFFSPITIILRYFPLLGNFFGAISSFIFGVVSFIVGSIFTLFTIAFAWLFYRPLYGMILIALAVALAILLKFYIIDHSK